MKDSMKYVVKGINEKNKRIEDEGKITIRYYLSEDTFDIKTVKDEPPVCRILSDSLVSGSSFEYIDVPFAALDEYGLDYAGIMIKSDRDSVEIKVETKNDSIFAARIYPERLQVGKITVRAFAKDNNPYRFQKTYSNAVIINNNENDWEAGAVDDSISSIYEYRKKSDDLKNRIEKIRNEMIASKEKESIADM